MRVIVIGAGEVGTAIAEALYRDNDVVLIERDRSRFDQLQSLDVLSLEGNGASPQILHEAGVESADLLIACTDVDEINIVACAASKQLGAPLTVARVHDPEFLTHWKRGYLGVDFMVCNELLTAQKIVMLLGIPEAKYVNEFAGGRILMSEIAVRRGSPLAGLTVHEAGAPPGCTIASLLRDEEVIIPRGDDVILEGDLVVNIGTPEAVAAFNDRLSRVKRTRDVVIVGGGRIGYRVAHLLEERGFSPWLLEADPERCQWLSERLPRTLVLNSDGTDIDFLKREKVETADVAVTVTETDEKNLLSALLLKQLGVGRVIARVDHASNIEAFEMVGVDVALNPRKLTADEILRFTRRRETEAVSLLEGNRAEVLEIEVPAGSRAVGRPLREGIFPRGTILGAIVRGEEVIIARGNDALQPGDRAIVFAVEAQARAVEALITR